MKHTRQEASSSGHFGEEEKEPGPCLGECGAAENHVTDGRV